MKKILPILLVSVLFLFQTACGNGVTKTSEESRQAESSVCEHVWNDATCTAPKTCALCGETEGHALEHDYQGSSCTEEAACALCGKTQAPTGHQWQEATCTSPKTCALCGETEGGPLGHTTESGTCERCGEFFFTALEFSGSGDSVISDVELGDRIYVAHFTHTGSSNFIVHQYDKAGEKELLVNGIGAYDGVVLLSGDTPYMFNIQANGGWSCVIDELKTTPNKEFSGTGDFITDIFSGSTGAYAFTHDGSSNFIVCVYTTRGYDLLINEIGIYNGEQIVEIPQGSNAFFKIIADGNWSISPK